MRQFIPLLSLLAACSGAPVKNICETVRTGKFQLMDRDFAPDQKWTIIRTDSIQKEINHSTGGVNILSVKWVSDCEYELRYLGSQPADTSFDVEERRKRVLRISITKVGEDFYDFKSIPESKDDFSINGRMRILKP